MATSSRTRSCHSITSTIGARRDAGDGLITVAACSSVAGIRRRLRSYVSTCSSGTLDPSSTTSATICKVRSASSNLYSMTSSLSLLSNIVMCKLTGCLITMRAP